MGDALVGPLVKLIPFLWEKLEKELRLPADAKGEFENLVGLINHIGRFLEKANSKEVIDERLKEHMKRMRKFLYVSQDAIDDLIRRESNLGWEGLASYLCHHYNRRTFAVESMAIRQMLEDNATIGERFAAIETFHGLSGDHAPPRLAGHWSSSIAYSEETDDELVGIEETRDQLVQWLTENDSMSKVIFMHGMQGVGKTSLVGAVLRNENVKSHFKYYVWIDDLRSCELVEDSAAALMRANAVIWDLTTRDNQGYQVELEEAFKRMRDDDDLRNNYCRWALVLDDVGSKHVFESLRRHLDQTRPSVLVTSRLSSLKYSLKSISRAFLDSPGAQPGGAPPEYPRRLHVFHIFYHLITFFTSSLASILRAFLDFRGAQPGGAPPEPLRRMHDFPDYKHVFLSADDSFTLFCRNMSLNGRCPTDLEEASDSILKKSEGLPLAILATCELLWDDQDSVTGTPDSATWNMLSGRLGEELLSKGDTGGPIGRMITLRMDHLLDVRACLFYLSIFPLDRPIRCSTMMRLWMAERFIEQDPVQKKAEKTLKKLLEHNVIQEKMKTTYGRVKTCCVHNLLHQIIISKSIDEEFAMIVAGPVENWPENVWHLSFHSDMNGEYEVTGAELLRSLLVFKTVYPKSLKNLLRKAKRLKVLDLQRHCSRASLKEFPEEIFRSKYLRYLSLRGTKVKKIPDDIVGLSYLETLDLKDTLVDELPHQILELKKLRHLLVCRYDRSPDARNDPKLGVKAPSKLGALKSLQKLCMIELNPVKWRFLPGTRWRRKELLTELGKLKNLQRLCISMLKTTDGELLCSSIEKLTNLEALRLIAAPEQEIDLSQIDEKRASKLLQRVHLTGRMGTLPKWILSPSLVELVLKGSQLNEDALQQLGELRSLKHLELQQAFDVREMTFKAGWFRQLRFLGLDTINSLESIKVEREALATLKNLSLARCQSLKIVPDITRLGELKCLELYDMPEEFNIAVERNEEVRTHMEVNFKDWKDGALEVVITLPAQPAGSPSAPPPCMK